LILAARWRFLLILAARWRFLATQLVPGWQFLYVCTSTAEFLQQIKWIKIIEKDREVPIIKGFRTKKPLCYPYKTLYQKQSGNVSNDVDIDKV